MLELPIEVQIRGRNPALEALGKPLVVVMPTVDNVWSPSADALEEGMSTRDFIKENSVSVHLVQRETKVPLQ